MKTVWAVAAVELREKRFVFLGALLAGLLPFGLSLLPGSTSDWSPDERVLVAVWIAAAFAAALAIILGASQLAKETADGRLRFYFARPLSGLGLWLGKVCSTVVLIALSAIVVILPSLAAARFVLRLEPVWLLAGLGIFPALFLAHGVSLAIRSRSAWMLVMLAVCVGCGAALWTCVDALRRIDVYDDLARPAADFFGVAATVALGAAGLRSVLRGRGDLRVSFLAFARVLIGTATLLAVIALGVLTWYRAVRPPDIEGFSTVVAAPDGDYLFVAGPAPSRPRLLASFLTDTAGRYSEFLRWFPWSATVPRFSANGSLAAWLDYAPGEIPSLRIRRLDGMPVANAITLHDVPEALTVSPIGDRVAVVVVGGQGSRAQIAIFDASSSRLLSAFASPPEFELLAARFVRSDRFRLTGWAEEPVFRGSQAHLQVFDFLVAERALQLQSTIAFPSHRMQLIRFDNTSRHALFMEQGESSAAPARRAWLVDLESGVGLAQFDGFTGIDFLFDGRVAESQVTSGGSWLRLYTPDGKPEKSFALPAARAVRIGPEIEPDRLLLLLVKTGTKASELLSLDLGSAQIRRLGSSLIPVNDFQYWLDVGRYLSKPGSPGTRLFLDERLALVRLDPQTAQPRVILGKGAR